MTPEKAFKYRSTLCSSSTFNNFKEEVISMNQSISERSVTLIDNSPRSTSDEQLVSAAITGECGAFVELCGRHSRKILQRIYRITGNWDDAEDALQDSLLRAFIHLKDFQGRSSFSSWLTRIGINSALMI